MGWFTVSGIFGLILGLACVIIIGIFYILYYYKPGGVDFRGEKEVKIVYDEEILEIESKRGDMPITTIEGVGKVYSDRLIKAGVETVEEFAAVIKPMLIARVAEISLVRAKRWQGMAQMLLLDSVGEEEAEGLVYISKIHSIKELAETNPDRIYRQFRRALNTGRLRVPKEYKPPTPSVVAKWVLEAQGELKAESAKERRIREAIVKEHAELAGDVEATKKQKAKRGEKIIEKKKEK